MHPYTAPVWEWERGGDVLIAFGLPTVVEALRKPSDRVTAVSPLPPKQARALYALDDDDRPQIERLKGAQRFEVAD